MVYLPSNRHLPATDEVSPPSAAAYARALLDPMVDTWRRQYAALPTPAGRPATARLNYPSSADLLTASAVRLAERIEAVRHSLNVTLRPCLDTPLLHDAPDALRAAILNLREAFDALLDWEREIRSVQVHCSLASIQGCYIGASTFVVENAIQIVDHWIHEAESGSASPRPSPEVLDAPPRTKAALADLRSSIRTRATINFSAWLIAGATIIYAWLVR